VSRSARATKTASYFKDHNGYFTDAIPNSLSMNSISSWIGTRRFATVPRLREPLRPRRPDRTLLAAPRADQRSMSHGRKAGAGIEPANRGFADPDLTTWLPRRDCEPERRRGPCGCQRNRFSFGVQRPGDWELRSVFLAIGKTLRRMSQTFVALPPPAFLCVQRTLQPN
jgi:hypothetical protein